MASAPTPPGDILDRATRMADAITQALFSVRPLATSEFLEPARLEFRFRSEEYNEARGNAYVADVESDVTRFAEGIAILYRYGVSAYPVLQFAGSSPESEGVPIDLFSLYRELTIEGGGIRYPLFPFGGREPREVMFGEGEPGRIANVETGNAIRAFRAGLIEFLQVRLDSASTENPEGGISQPILPQSPQPSSQRVTPQRIKVHSLGGAVASSVTLTPAPYLPFTVCTRTPNLDLEQAPAYFLNWTYFGGPTTPTNGWILPGLYRFRGRDAAGRHYNDPVKFKVPPTFTANANL
ncbi:MAG TPA: hypothetical protein VEG32_05870 [Clostridia bacterium]|nr:hypothetical protein [Clostridia bacterium]